MKTVQRVIALVAVGAAMLALGAGSAWAGPVPVPTVDVEPEGAGSGQVNGTTFAGTDILNPDCTWNGAAQSGDCETDTFAAPTAVTFTATALAGSDFVDWNGTCPTTPTGPEGEICAFTADPATPIVLRPEFAPDTAAEVSIVPSGSGSGTITGSADGVPNEFDCTWNGTTVSGDCQEDIPAAELPAEIVLTAAATGGSTFPGFTAANCPGTISGTGNTVCTFTVDDAGDDVTVQASFTGPDVVANLVVEPQGDGSGTVTGTGPSGQVVNCVWNGTATSGDCEEAVGTGQGGTFTLTATPATGSDFTSWTNCPGTVSADGTQCSFTIDGPEDDHTIRPVFALEQGPPPPAGCTITGTEGDDTLTGTSGRDVICGLGGDDTIRAGGGSDVVLGGPGNDVIAGGGGGDDLSGGAGADQMDGKQGTDDMSGGDGADRMLGGAGSDALSGGGGPDRLFGNGGSDALSGGAGRDSLYGGRGPDLLGGGPGRDFANGGPGGDRCTAERRVSC
jgi:hypothetical protein